MSAGPPYTKFGPDTPEASIEQNYSGFTKCMIYGSQCMPEGSVDCGIAAAYTNCDDLIGSWSTKTGVCGDSKYWSDTYCACVNNAVPCPMFQDPVCGNSSSAYQPSSWFTMQGTGADAVMVPSGQAAICKDTPICVNLVQVGGASNVLPGTVQECGSFSPITNTYSANTYLVIMVFILIMILAWLLGQSNDDDQAPSAPSAPSSN